MPKTSYAAGDFFLPPVPHRCRRRQIGAHFARRDRNVEHSRPGPFAHRLALCRPVISGGIKRPQVNQISAIVNDDVAASLIFSMVVTHKTPSRISNPKGSGHLLQQQDQCLPQLEPLNVQFDFGACVDAGVFERFGVHDDRHSIPLGDEIDGIL